MMYRNAVRFWALAATVALSLLCESRIAGGSTQEPREQSEASLLATADAIPDVGVVLTKKPDRQFSKVLGLHSESKSRSKPVSAASRPGEGGDGQPAGNKKTNKDGSFSFENVPVGTYNLTFDAPKVSPAMSGKVEYLVIIQQVVAGGADNPAKTTPDELKAKTARIPISKIRDGLDFTVGPPPPQPGIFPASKSKNSNVAATDSQPKEAKQSPPAMNLRGKIFLVEIGTTRIVRDQPGEKPPGQ